MTAQVNNNPDITVFTCSNTNGCYAYGLMYKLIKNEIYISSSKSVITENKNPKFELHYINNDTELKTSGLLAEFAFYAIIIMEYRRKTMRQTLAVLNKIKSEYKTR